MRSNLRYKKINIHYSYNCILDYDGVMGYETNQLYPDGVEMFAVIYNGVVNKYYVRDTRITASPKCFFMPNQNRAKRLYATIKLQQIKRGQVIWK